MHFSPWSTRKKENSLVCHHYQIFQTQQFLIQYLCDLMITQTCENPSFRWGLQNCRTCSLALPKLPEDLDPMIFVWVSLCLGEDQIQQCFFSLLHLYSYPNPPNKIIRHNSTVITQLQVQCFDETLKKPLGFFYFIGISNLSPEGLWLLISSPPSHRQWISWKFVK